MPWKDLKQIFRPEGVHMGVMRTDPEKCSRTRGSRCTLCMDNCPFRAWEAEEGESPHHKAEYQCFSCYNCMVACPRNAVSIVDPYHVDEGFFKSEPYPLPAEMPREPRDADGNPDEWNAIERAVLNRRSVRNFRTDKPVPEHLIRRVLEAGRFAPSAGNCQPWKFIVITDKALIQEMDEAIWTTINMLYNMYNNDEMVKGLATGYEANPTPGLYDPRIVIGGMGSISKRYGPGLLAAPAVILMLADVRSIGSPEMNLGICGQNMTLVANSLGLGACWVGFVTAATMNPAIREKLGIAPPWEPFTSIVLGYPKFKQEGMVAREYRPVTWFREGSGGPEIEEYEPAVLAAQG
jgi:nitroreductase/NAD-dependent dihydropyrimidine dehydrogenase PreA subunit